MPAPLISAHTFFGLEGLPQQLMSRQAVGQSSEQRRRPTGGSRRATAFTSSVVEGPEEGPRGRSLSALGQPRPQRSERGSPLATAGTNPRLQMSSEQADVVSAGPAVTPAGPVDLRKEHEKMKEKYLREMSWDEEQRTVYHDLLTPHRSYAFRAQNPVRSPIRRWTAGSAVEASALGAGEQIEPPGAQTPQGLDRSLSRALSSLQEQGATGMEKDEVPWKADGPGLPKVITRRSVQFPSKQRRPAPASRRDDPLQRVASRIASKGTEAPSRLYKFKAKTMLVLSQEFHDQNASLQNELAGPFQNPDKIRGVQYCGPTSNIVRINPVWQGLDRPSVRSLSTFEEYLERTVNSIRGASHISFQPSRTQAQPTNFEPRRKFSNSTLRNHSIRSRSQSSGEVPQLDFQGASNQLALRAERSSTSLGFSPAREVAEMHRTRPPWMVDPPLFVRVFAAVKQDDPDSSPRGHGHDFHGSRLGQKDISAWQGAPSLPLLHSDDEDMPTPSGASSASCSPEGAPNQCSPTSDRTGGTRSASSTPLHGAQTGGWFLTVTN